MAAEFYHKTAALFEEFKKRELRYLHSDKGMKNNLSWKNDFDMSTQDYLQKINKRERETEQTYRELMKHMEALDKQTDQMSLKLEKLHALRNIAISSNNSAWPSVDDTFDRPLQSYNRTLIHNTPIMHSIPTSNALHSISGDFTLPKFNYCDESTQTDGVICAQCHFPLTMYPNHISYDSKTVTNTNESAVLLHKLNETLQNPKERGVQFIPSTPTDNIKESYTAVDHNIIEKLSYESFKQNLNASAEIPSQMEFSKKENVSAEVPTLKFANDGEVHRETEVHWSKSNDHKIDTNEKESADENIVGSTGTIEHTVSKSDDESMNHEFDFLESDKRNSIKSDDTQLYIIDPNFNNQSNLVTENFNLEGSYDATFQENSKSSMKINSVSEDVSDFKQTKQVSEMPYVFDAENMERIKISEDLKLDSSVSGGHPTPPFHSENASLASESDSFSEKETPLTTTAAYQALLGNVSAAKTAQKRQPISDSDSEDEIENALATAVRKSSNVTFETPGLSLKTEGRKESVAEAKLKTETKASISSNKPQTKLSKSTRKVLGLDTSSGSEVELAVKTDTNKNAEDSDEFDFYD